MESTRSKYRTTDGGVEYNTGLQQRGLASTCMYNGVELGSVQRELSAVAFRKGRIKNYFRGCTTTVLVISKRHPSSIMRRVDEIESNLAEDVPQQILYTYVS